MQNLSFPPLIVVTASTKESSNDTLVQEVLEFIESNNIPVFVFTFATLNNSFLSELTTYGSFFTGKNLIISTYLYTVPLETFLFVALFFCSFKFSYHCEMFKVVKTMVP